MYALFILPALLMHRIEDLVDQLMNNYLYTVLLQVNSRHENGMPLFREVSWAEMILAEMTRRNST